MLFRSLIFDDLLFTVDMDYTLAVYKSPEYEALAYRLAIKKLLKKGYPKEIETLTYDPSFPIRYVI